MKKIALFASGSGSNVENIANYFSTNDSVSIDIILANKPDAYVLERAKNLNLESKVFNRADFYESDSISELLKNRDIDLVVLAGFLWLIPEHLVTAFPNKIINIHPALLPNYGGKGMYGNKVHEAVVNNKETESGITIHYVNEKYDEGAIIFQAKVSLAKDDTAETLAKKIHQLEYEHFPKVIDKLLA